MFQVYLLLELSRLWEERLARLMRHLVVIFEQFSGIWCGGEDSFLLCSFYVSLDIVSHNRSWEFLVFLFVASVLAASIKLLHPFLTPLL